MMMTAKPAHLSGRDDEWEALERFVASQGGETRLGIVYGRRRQGKTVLLDALCERHDGFMWQARQQSGPQNLADLENALGRFTGTTPRLSSWDDAAAALCGLHRSNGDGAPLPVVVDEVGYLLDGDPGFASRLQAALAPGVNRRRKNAVRLILCGSAFGQMRGLIDANAPLRGRAQLDLVVRPFRFGQMAEYWKVDNNPDLAFRMHAILGGTPAYREFAAHESPRRGDLDSWVTEHVLSSSSPLFREGRIVVGEDPALGDRSLYWSVLGAIADGARTRGEITDRLGRPPSSLAYPLTTLLEAGWLGVESDPLRARSSHFFVDEPIVRFHRLVVEPAEHRLTRRANARAVWEEALPLVRSQIYGPHLERMVRDWVVTDAPEAVTGGRVHACGSSSLGSGTARLALDVLATAATPRGGHRVCAIGEVKATEQRVGAAELQRLDHAVALIPEALRPTPPQLLLVSRAGFTRDVETLARRRPDVHLLGLTSLMGS